MGPGSDPERDLGEGYSYFSLGITFAAAIVLFALGGWLLDRWLGITPALTIVGTLAGSALSFFWVYAKLKSDEETRRKSDRGRRGR